MKKIKQLVFFLIYSNLAFAQNWCAPGAEWLYRVYWPSFLNHQDGFLRVKVDSSYTQAGINYHVLNGTFYGTQLTPNSATVTVPNRYRTTTYEANKVVYVSRQYDPTFDTLANFNAAIGDQWLKSDMYSYCPPTNTLGIHLRYVTVIDTGHVVINNVSLKKLLVSLHPSSTTNTITLVEKIGCLEQFMYPYCTGGIDVWNLGTFACYSDNNFPTYKNPNYNLSCDYTTVDFTEYSSGDHHIKVYPNPSHDVFRISLEDFPNGKAITLSLQGPLGTLLLSKTVDGPEEISLIDYVPGLYLLKLSAGGRDIACKKLIKTGN